MFVCVASALTILTNQTSGTAQEGKATRHPKPASLQHSKDTIIAAGAVPLLVALLSCDHRDVQEAALMILKAASDTF